VQCSDEEIVRPSNQRSTLIALPGLLNYVVHMVCNLRMTERDERRMEVGGWQEGAGKKEAGDACVCSCASPWIFYLNPYFRSFQFEQLVIFNMGTETYFLPPAGNTSLLRRPVGDLASNGEAWAFRICRH
jgi:hypothetical protein